MIRKNRFSKYKITLVFLVLTFILLYFIYQNYSANNLLKEAKDKSISKSTPWSTSNPNRLFTTPADFSPKKGDKYAPINLSSPAGGYSKKHSLESGPEYKVGSSCWADKQIFTVPNSEKLAFACNGNQFGIDITGVTIPGIKVYQYCQIETGQILIYSAIPRNDISGSLQLVNPDGTIIGVAVLPTLPKQYHQEIEYIVPVVITKNNLIYLFVLTSGNRVANDSLKIDFDKGTSEILTPPTYINEGKCP